MTFDEPQNIIPSTHANDAKGGRLQIGRPGRLEIGMHGRLRRYPHLLSCACEGGMIMDGIREFLEPTHMQSVLSLWGRWVRDRPVLYHGTRYAAQILAADKLQHAPYGDRCVSFTRLPEVAVNFAMSDRDDDEGKGSVLILDRRALQARYEIDIRHCPVWGDQAHDEAEEAVWGDIAPLSRYLLDVVEICPLLSLHKQEARA